MKSFFIKLGLLLYLWYEVSAELHMTGGTTLVFTLLAGSVFMMHPRLPARVLALPRVMLLVAPTAVWFVLAWCLAPATVQTYPAFVLLLAAVLALAGGGTHYAVARYPEWFAQREAMVRQAITPGASLLLVCAGRQGMLALAVTVMLIGLPLRLGWRMIGPALANASAFQDQFSERK